MDFAGADDIKVEEKVAFDRVTERASLANLLRPGKYRKTMKSVIVFIDIPPISFESSSIGCLSAVISLKVQRNRTTMSLSFLIGDMCINSHRGVPGKKSVICTTVIRVFNEALSFKEKILGWSVGEDFS